VQNNTYAVDEIAYPYRQATMQTRGVTPDISGRHDVWNFFTVPNISGALSGEAVNAVAMFSTV